MDNIKDEIRWETVPPLWEEEREKLSGSLSAVRQAVLPARSKLRVSRHLLLS